MPCRRETCAMTILSLFFVSLFVYGSLIPLENTSVASETSTKVKKNEYSHIRILAVGDSLTAGITRGDGVRSQAPYAPLLEKALEQTFGNVTVFKKGFPGWTSVELRSGRGRGGSFLREMLDEILPLDLVIILAGTNDILGRLYKDPQNNVSANVIALHQECYDQNVPHTIALEIPGAKPYLQSGELSEQVEILTRHLKQFSAFEPKATFVPFPFEYSEGDDKWSTDGM